MIAAYGVRFDGAVGPEDWPAWAIDVAIASADDRDGMSIWPDTARIGLPGLGEVRLDRARRTVTFAVRQALPAEELAHPWLGRAGVVIAHWEGRTSLHGGAVVVDGRVWGLLAERGGGKSTMAALLCERGCGLFTDDVLVSAGGRAFAGPPTVDVRPEAAALLGGEALSSRDRRRRTLPRPLFEGEVAGFVSLEWGPERRADRLDAAERLRRLHAQTVLPGAATGLLDLVAAPMIGVRRAPDLDSARGEADRLLALIAQE